VPGFRLSKTDGGFVHLFRALVLAHIRAKKKPPPCGGGFLQLVAATFSASAFRAAAAASQQAQPTEEHREGAGPGDGGEGKNTRRGIKGSGIARVDEIDR